MKKILAMLTVLLLLTACGADDTKPSETSAPETTAAAQETTAETTQAATEATTAETTAQETEEPIVSVLGKANLLRLEPDTDYTYDLDGDGTEETISYSTTVGEYEYVYGKLSINGSEQTTDCDTADGYSVNLILLDLDLTDGKLQLLWYVTSDSQSLSCFTVFDYANGAFQKISDLTEGYLWNDMGQFFRGGLETVNGDGTFAVQMDSPYYMPPFGCYYLHGTYRYENGTIQFVPQDIYELSDISEIIKSDDNYYQAIKDFTTTTEPDGATQSFTAKEGTQYPITALKITDTMFFAEITDEASGAVGWISYPISDEYAFEASKEYFKAVPGWG